MSTRLTRVYHPRSKIFFAVVQTTIKPSVVKDLVQPGLNVTCLYRGGERIAFILDHCCPASHYLYPCCICHCHWPQTCISENFRQLIQSASVPHSFMSTPSTFDWECDASAATCTTFCTSAALTVQLQAPEQ